MRRLLAAAMVLALGPAATSRGITPQDEYLGFFTALGAAGGGALGASMGALSTPAGGSTVRPSLRWGAAGAVFGGYLGREIASDALSKVETRRDVKYATRESNTCLGAVSGGMLGLAAGTLIRSLGEGDSRSSWGGIAVGTLTGAAVTFMLPPIALLPPPPRESVRERTLSMEMRRLEPLIPHVDAEREKLLGAEKRSDLGPPPPASVRRSQLQDLGFTRLAAEDPLLIQPGPFSIYSSPQPSAPSPLPPPDISKHMPAVFLAALEGAVLGGSLAGSFGTDDEDFWKRTLLGGALGSIAGGMASIMLMRPEPGTDEETFVETGAIELQNQRAAGMMSGGLLGSIIGAAAGATIRNTEDGFSRTKIARLVLSGNLAGQLAGYVLCSLRF